MIMASSGQKPPETGHDHGIPGPAPRRNGVSLLKLIAGELRPGSGAVRACGEVGYLPQAITLGTRRTVSDLLGITAVRQALHAIEAGETGEAAFTAVGDEWDVEERARAWLDRLGLGSIGLDDRVERLSGGERFRAVLAALLLAQPEPQLLLLDEPTNNLDMASVRQLSQALEGYRGAIVVASHDVPFLGTVGISRWLRLDREAGLTAIDPL